MGVIQKYRGLDSHYWSIYHKDFESLVTTLHRVTPILTMEKLSYKGK